MSASAEAPEVVVQPIDAPPTRSVGKRRIWLLIILVIALLIVAAGTTFAVKVATENAIGAPGTDTSLVGSGVTRNDDPFGAEPGGAWAEVDYQPGGTIIMGMNVTNDSHTQTVTIRSFTFDGVAPADGFSESGISNAVVGVDYRLNFNSSDVQPFHPFQIPPGGIAYIQWTLTMCPTGTIMKDRSQAFSTFEVDYTYFGFHKHETLPLATPLRIDNEGHGCT